LISDIHAAASILFRMPRSEFFYLSSPDLSRKIDDLVKNPHAALRRILRHCSVPQVRFIPQYLRALPANILRSRPKFNFLRDLQNYLLMAP
jgi:hypothetical protein